MPKHGVNPPQTSEEDSNGNLDGNVRKIDNTHRKADLPTINSEGGDETQSKPWRSKLLSTSQEYSLQLADAHATDVSPKTNENLSQVVEQCEQKPTISAVEASRSLRNGHTNAGDQSFTMLSPTENSGFRTRHADPHNKTAVVAALRLFSGSHFMTNASGKRLKGVSDNKHLY